MSDKLIHRPVVSERLLDDPAQQPGLLHGLSLSSIGADVLGNDGPGQRQPRLLHRGACPTPRVDHIVQRVVSDKQPSPRRRIGRCTARARKIVTGVPSLR